MHIFFLDKWLRELLENTPLSDLEGIKKFLYENVQSNDVLHLYSKEQNKHVIYRFALHLPYEAEGFAFSLSLENDGSVELYFAVGENGGRISDKFYADTTKKVDEISLATSKMFRLAINTSAYINCFPHCVADGVPKNLFEKNEDRLAKTLLFIYLKRSEITKIHNYQKYRILEKALLDYFNQIILPIKKGKLLS